jgi:hypothetical protein
MTQEGATLGTPFYIPPEQIRETHIDARRHLRARRDSLQCVRVIVPSTPTRSRILPYSSTRASRCRSPSFVPIFQRFRRGGPSARWPGQDKRHGTALELPTRSFVRPACSARRWLARSWRGACPARAGSRAESSGQRVVRVRRRNSRFESPRRLFFPSFSSGGLPRSHWCCSGESPELAPGRGWRTVVAPIAAAVAQGAVVAPGVPRVWRRCRR